MRAHTHMLLIAILSVTYLGGCPAGNSTSFTLDGLPALHVRAPYLSQLEVSGTDQEVEFAVTAGRLPFGLQLEPDGRLHGVPIAVQQAAFTITASSTSGSGQWVADSALTVSDPDGMRLLVEELPVAAPDQAYSHTFTTVGGTPSSWGLLRVRTFSAAAAEPNQPPPSSDDIPAWLSLNPATGLLSGTAPVDEQLILLLVEATQGNDSAQETYALRIPGRAYEHRENIDGPCGHWYMNPGANPEQHQGSGEFSDYRFWVETSRDQITGNLWGHAIVHETLVKRPDLRALASENIVSVTEHIWDNEMKLIDLDGLTTNYGMMSGYGFDGFDPYVVGTTLANGMNAIMLINWFQMTSQIAADEGTRQDFAERLQDLISDQENPEPGREFEHSYLDILEDSYAYAAYPPGDYFVNMKWYNAHMAFSSFFHAVRRAEDPGLRQTLLDAFSNILWEDVEPMESGCDKPELRRARREFNPHFSWQYLAAYGDRDPEVIFEALSQMMYWLAIPRTDYIIVNPLNVETVPGQPGWACEVLPVHVRPQSSNYLWHRDPYRHTGGNDTPGREDGGGDGFVPYWMGRYFGFVPSNI
ncbi:MAG: putative Ig domain-containing protein [Deltaproteobacteria bacterium]|nr:putative Ig domain-containing protein [Deltaproteobacteria bacterium]